MFKGAKRARSVLEQKSMDKAKKLSKFIHILSVLLGALEEVFPECPLTKKENQLFQLRVASSNAEPSERVRCIQEWHETSHPYYSRILSGLIKQFLEESDNYY